MLVYKTFFKVMKKYKVSLTMYSIIIIAMLIFTAKMYASNSKEVAVEDKQYTLLVVDNDQSDISKEFVEYLGTKHTLKEGSFSDDQIKDLLYYENISEYIVIPEGFGDEFKKAVNSKTTNETDEFFTDNLLQATYDEALPRGIFINMQINQYLNAVRDYMASGMSLKEASEKTTDALDTSKFVEIQKKEIVSSESIYTSFQFLPFGIISIIFSGVLPAIMSFNETEKKNRTIVSSHKMTSRNFALVLGSATLAFLVTTVLVAIVSITNKAEYIGTSSWILSIVNAFIYTLAATMLLSMITSIPMGIATKGTANTTSYVTCIISLSFAFLGGTFVDLTILGDKVGLVGRFTPNYWYSTALRKIWFEGGNLNEVIGSFGIELLFGIVCMSIGLVFTKFFRERR